MKRTCLFLLIIICIGCLRQGYELMTKDATTQNQLTGSLSDIAEEVVAVPLEPAGDYHIKKARNIRQEGNNLFLISNETLYRYNRKGEFICRITDPGVIKVAGYVLNPINQEIIVLGNTDDIYYYNFNGNLLETKKLKSDLPGHHLQSVSLYKDKIWTTEECMQEDTTSQALHIEKQVVEYDTSFRKINTKKIIPADLGYSLGISTGLPAQLSIAEDTGVMYAYTPPMRPDNLLRDTLYLKQKQETGTLFETEEGAVPLFPIRVGCRFWVSSYHNKADASGSYTFCYDQQNNRSWEVKGGFKDNFYETGTVPELEAMDLFNQAYCFCKSGKEIQKVFPEQTKRESAVLFIVKLKA